MHSSGLQDCTGSSGAGLTGLHSSAACIDTCVCPQCVSLGFLLHCASYVFGQTQLYLKFCTSCGLMTIITCARLLRVQLYFHLSTEAQSDPHLLIIVLVAPFDQQAHNPFARFLCSVGT